MTDKAHSNNVIQFYDTHPINEQQIMEKLAAANPRPNRHVLDVIRKVRR